MKRSSRGTEPGRSLARSSVFVALFFLVGCGGDGVPAPSAPDAPIAVTPSDVAPPAPRSGPVVVSNEPGDWGADHFVLNAGSIREDLLTLNLSYGGGCATHAFTLVASEAFMESWPVQLAVSVAHRANGDPCQAWLTEDYDFDLTVIRDRYRQAYGDGAAEIVLLLAGLPDGPLVYSFS